MNGEPGYGVAIRTQERDAATVAASRWRQVEPDDAHHPADRLAAISRCTMRVPGPNRKPQLAGEAGD